MSKKIIILTVFLFSICSTGLAEDDTYVDKTYGFEITCPKGWSREAQSEKTTALVVFSKKQFTEQPKITQSIEVSVAELRPDAPTKDAMDVANSMMEYYKSFLPNMKVIKNPKWTKLRDADGVLFINDYSAPNGPLVIRNIHIFLLQGRNVLMIRTVCDANDYNEAMPAFTESLKSFTLFPQEGEISK